MRDLEKDLEICNKATKGPWVFDKYDVDIWSQPNLWRVANVRLYADMQFIAAAREGWPHAIERAIKAEAEVERLKKHLRWATDTEGTYKCQNCQNLVESEYTNRLFCSYHSEGEYQHETFLDDYCNYFESKKEGER